MSFIWNISSCLIFSHKKRDNALCPSWKPRLICQIQLQSIGIHCVGLTVNSLLRGALLQTQWFRYQTENGSAFPITGTRFKDTMEVQFFPFTKPVGMESQEDWLELQIFSVNLMFSKRITVWINILRMAGSPVYFHVIQIWLHAFFSWNTVQFCCTGGEAMLFFSVQLL